jgi:hypothetical protein
MWEPKTPGTLWATKGFLGTPLPFIFYRSEKNPANAAVFSPIF